MSAFAGTGDLVRLALRRDRLRAPLWLLGIGGVVGGSGSAVAGLYRTQEAIDGYAALAESPTTVAFAGPPVGLHRLEGIVVYEVSLTAILGISVLAVLMVSRHTRAEEESGRIELVRAAAVGRHAHGAAALVAAGLMCLGVGLALTIALLPTALDLGQAVLFAAGMTVLGLFFAGLTLCLAQLFVHARTVTGAGLLAVAAAYVVRAAGDVREDWLVWATPIGWVQATHVPTAARWWPLLLPLLAMPLLVALAVALAERRDFGGGLVPTRSGRPRATRWLSGPFSLGWRMQRSAVTAWTVAVFALATLIGSLSESVQDMIRDNPLIADYLAVAEGASITDSYLATMLMIMALVAAGFAVWSAGHPGAAEGSGQLSLILAGPTSRMRVLLADVAVTVCATTVVMTASACGVALSHGAVMGDPAEGWRVGVAQFAYLPAVLVLVGLVVFLDGWRPAWTGLVWVVLAFSFVVGWLGSLLRPPRWVVDLSPFEHTPRVLLEPAGGAALPVLLAVAAGLALLGALGKRRRDVVGG